MQFQNKAHPIAPLSLRFEDSDIEEQYIAHHNLSAVPGLRLVILLCIGFVALPLGIEYYGFVQEGWDGYEN